jgi:hypothetical protein
MRAAPSSARAAPATAPATAAGRSAQLNDPARDSASGWAAVRRGRWLAPAALLLGALGLRLWGVAQGLPYVYNSDENDHFVPPAIHMFATGSLNPEYFANPPALTYVLHFLYLAWFGGAGAAERAAELHPTEVYVLARITVALLGTAAVWLLYLTGRRLFGRGAGLLAAAIEAVAFLPVFYAHLALNDAPTLAPLTLSLLGTAGILRFGRRRDYLIAGIGLGLACATKYTAGIVLLPLLVAAFFQVRGAPGSGEGGQARGIPGSGERVAVGLLIAGVAALVSFVIANPYSLLDFHRFHAELNHQSQLSGEAQGKLGAGHAGGIRYYLWSLTWGLGWLPSLAALGGTVLIWRRDARLGWLLVPAALLFLVFMGLQGRYFGRWLLPIFPIACLLGAFCALALVDAAVGWLPRGALARRVRSSVDTRNRNRNRKASEGATARTGAAAHKPRLRAGLTALIAILLCAQGLIYSIHSDLVLSRTDTRTLAREWMVTHIPPGSSIVAEPVSPEAWAYDIGHFNPNTLNGARWSKYDSERQAFAPNGAFLGEAGPTVGIEDYERTLRPALIPYYESQGYCWVIVGSAQSGRAYAEPRAVPQAIAYYQALARQARVLYRVSPYTAGAKPVAFNFDWSFDYYPLSYQRPGPEMTIYRLSGGRCRA